MTPAVAVGKVILHGQRASHPNASSRPLDSSAGKVLKHVSKQYEQTHICSYDNGQLLVEKLAYTTLRVELLYIASERDA